MKTRNQFFYVLMVSGLILFACNKEELNPKMQETIQNENVDDGSYIQKEGMIVLGEKINDPYAIYNMETAYSNLKSAGVEVPVNEIKPNKTYLRFLPKDEAEWDLLKSDTNIVLYDFPLDYEIAVYGTYYHDPGLPDSAITWQYTVVPIDYPIPNVAHEILYEVIVVR